MRFIAIVFMFIALAGCAKPQILEKGYAPENILHLSAFRTLKAPAAINRNIGYLDPGDRIPLKLEIQSDLFGLAQEQVDLVARQRLYFRVSLPEGLSQADLDKILSLDQDRLNSMTEREKRALFRGVMLFAGKDGIKWAPLNDMRALRHIFGIGGGELAFGVSMSEAQGVWASFSLKLHPGETP